MRKYKRQTEIDRVPIIDRFIDSTRQPRYGLSPSKSESISGNWPRKLRLNPHLHRNQRPHMHRSDESPRALKQEANVKRILNNSSSTTGYPSRRRNRSRNIRPICHLTYRTCLSTRHRYRTISSPIRSCTVRINHMCRILWIRHNSNRRCNKRSIKVRVAPIRLRVALIKLRLVHTRRLRYSPRIIRANNISRPDIINHSLV